jgi:hypothetical protein
MAVDAVCLRITLTVVAVVPFKAATTEDHAVSVFSVRLLLLLSAEDGGLRDIELDRFLRFPGTLLGDREHLLGDREYRPGDCEYLLGARERLLGDREYFLGDCECLLGDRELLLDSEPLLGD